MDNNEQDIEKLTNFLNDIFGVNKSENEPWEPECQEGEPECQEENNNQNNNPRNPNHYADMSIDALDVMSVNFSNEAYMGFLEGNVLKYIMRYRNKNGLEDLIKAQRYLDILIERQEMEEAAENN